MVEALGQEAHECVVLIGGKGIFTEYLREKARVVSLNNLGREISLIRDILALIEIRRSLRKLQPDLVSAHSAKAGLLVRIGAIGLKIPVIFTAHGWAFTEGVSPFRRKIFLLLERLVTPLAAKIICVSEYDRELALSSKLGPPERFVVIHNGMPDISGAKELSDPAKEESKFLMVGRFDDQKDHELLLRATKEVDGFALTLVGGGRLLGKAQGLAKALGLKGRVKFTGRMIETKELFASHQGYLLISKWEGLPRSIIEAMRAGMPVITSDVGGCKELVEDGVNGYLVPRGDLNTLISRLRYLANSQALRVSMGNESRRRYENGFTFDRMFEKTFKVYRQVISRDMSKKDGREAIC
jgi:glycosyltransferase involved in cell wall biosynthesis